MEAVAVLLAAAAFVVSVASLYLTSLRPAEIELDFLPDEGTLRPSGYSGSEMTGPDVVRLRVFVSNTGAHGGLLHWVAVTGVEAEPEGLWAGVRRLTTYTLHSGPTPDSSPAVPAALEAGDGDTAWVVVELTRAATRDPEDFAARLGRTGDLTLTVEWTFFRARTLSVRDRGREPVTRRAPLSPSRRTG